MDFLIERLQKNPDITLRELANALKEEKGVSVQLSSIHRALRRPNYSYKKRAHRR
jgi:transposase